MHYLLFYDFVKYIVERRAPYREKHLKRVRERTNGERVSWPVLSAILPTAPSRPFVPIMRRPLRVS